MLLHRRRHGSQRAMSSLRLHLMPNAHGDAQIRFKGADGIWYSLEPETVEEMRQLMSEAHVLHHNWHD